MRHADDESDVSACNVLMRQLRPHLSSLDEFLERWRRLCEQAIARLRVNTLFLSASAVVGSLAYIQDQQIVRIKQAMMAAAQKRILLLDHHKFNRVALHALGDLNEFDMVLVTRGLSLERKDNLRERNVRLQIINEDD
jgi:DeoR/GlpR family transcriptional regulator of sugar metabolism